MTDNEIIKALEYCTSGDDCSDNCPLRYSDVPSCFSALSKPMLDLINRQKAEIERLQNALFKQEDTMQMIVKERDTEIDRLKAKYEKLLKRKEQLEVKTSEKIHSLYAEKRTLEAMVEDLHNLIGKEFTCFVGNPHKVEHCPYLEEFEIAKAEAIKEFAERLKEIMCQENEIYISCAKNMLSKDFQRGYEEKNDDVIKHINNLVKEMVGEE